MDIKAKDLDNCMKNNYYSSAYAAKSMLDIWTEDDKEEAQPGPHPKLRQIIFINSAAAFLGLPGSIAYTRKLLFIIINALKIGLTNICFSQSGQKRGPSLGGYTADRSATILQLQVHLLDPLCLPRRFPLTRIQARAGNQDSANETHSRNQPNRRRTGDQVSFFREGGCSHHCSGGQGRFHHMRGLTGGFGSVYQYDRTVAEERVGNC